MADAGCFQDWGTGHGMGIGFPPSFVARTSPGGITLWAGATLRPMFSPSAGKRASSVIDSILLFFVVVCAFFCESKPAAQF